MTLTLVTDDFSTQLKQLNMPFLQNGIKFLCHNIISFMIQYSSVKQKPKVKVIYCFYH